MTVDNWQDRIQVQTADFSVDEEYQRMCQSNVADGAVVFFVGPVRDRNQGDQVSLLELEHYPGMTEKALQGIVDDARSRWQLGRVSVVHRVGPMNIEEQIVFVGVSSAHRGNAFEAAEYIMDYLKSRAPFWKKERILDANGELREERWVDARDSDSAALERWE